MILYPEQTCVLCDLPWKNNRVRYDGHRALTLRPRELELGKTVLRIEKDGSITADGAVAAQTGLIPNEQTIAFDSLHKLVYFASGSLLAAFDLERLKIAFVSAVKGAAGAPTLFEWFLPDGTICAAVGFSDAAGSYLALDRTDGKVLWRADTLGAVVDAAAHLNGYLYMTLEGEPCQVLCLEARTGELVWWNRGRLAAVGGVICGGFYNVLYKDGTWQRFLTEDGERLP